MGFVGDTNFEQRANLKIQDGCDFMCSFCIIPFARGRARAREYSDLVSEAKEMLTKGVREIVLTGVNLGTYLSQKYDFLALLDSLSSLGGLDRLRISSIEPTTIPEEIFAWMADPAHPLMPFLHVPLQSCSDPILSKMKRRYRIGEMEAFFARAEAAIPRLCMGTDLMVGYPGESESHFQETCDRFMSFPLSYCHVFTYSERDGTPAAKQADHVSMNIRRQRSAHLRRLSASKRMDFHQRHLGKEVEVLLENPKNRTYSGYTDNYLKVVVPESPQCLENRMARVLIEDARPEFCLGKLLSWEERAKS